MFQVATRTRADLAGAKLVSLVRQPADKHHSAALTRIASRISTVSRHSPKDSDDPSANARGLIKDLLNKVMEAAAGAFEKGYGDEQLANTTAGGGGAVCPATCYGYPRVYWYPADSGNACAPVGVIKQAI